MCAGVACGCWTYGYSWTHPIPTLSSYFFFTSSSLFFFNFFSNFYMCLYYSLDWWFWDLLKLILGCCCRFGPLHLQQYAWYVVPLNSICPRMHSVIDNVPKDLVPSVITAITNEQMNTDKETAAKKLVHPLRQKALLYLWRQWCNADTSYAFQQYKYCQLATEANLNDQRNCRMKTH